jgi:DNA-binding transcriptional regulator YiaG
MMTPDELYNLIDRLQITQGEAARILGIAPRTMRNYLSGATAIPEPTAKLLRLIRARRLDLQQVEKA